MLNHTRYDYVGCIGAYRRGYIYGPYLGLCTTPLNNVRLSVNDLRLVVDLLEVEAGINQAHVVYTPEQCVELANRLRWILVREREKENRQNEKR